jgi:GntR family transcriptional regulator
MTEIQRPGALYQQVAAEIREAHPSGEYKPGAPLPSEAQLIERYQVSRPTVRNAIAALRAEGLIEVIHGKGSFVRADPAPAVTIERTITRDGKFTPDPRVESGRRTEPSTAPRPRRPRPRSSDSTKGKRSSASTGCSADPDTGTRALHRTDPVRHRRPGRTTSGRAGHRTGRDLRHPHRRRTQAHLVRDRPRPHAPTRRAQHAPLPDATPILHTARVTYGTDDRPLILEDLRASADRAQLTYRITADRSPMVHAVSS